METQSRPEAPELAALERRIAELEKQLEAHEDVKQRLAETEDWLRLLLDSSDEMMGVSVKGMMTQVNPRFASMFGYTPEEVIGKPAALMHPPETRAIVEKHIREGYDKPYQVPCMRKDGSTFLAEICGKATTYHGRPARVTLIRDITAQQQAEEALRAALVQKEVIRAQESILAELSTPLLPITDDIVVLPLIGAVNTERAAQVIEALVHGVTRHGARIAILDITGVPDVDIHIADALLKAARSVQLLGARVMLTGIRPGVAQRFVMLGADFSGIMTYGTLQRGVADALNRR